MVKLVNKCVQSCEICAKDNRTPNAKITPEVVNLPERDLGPEDAMQLTSSQTYHQAENTTAS